MGLQPKKFNLNGRVCADTLIPLGLLGLGMIYGIKPFSFHWLDRFSPAALQIARLALGAVTLGDMILSTCVLSKIRSTATPTQADNTQELAQGVRELLMRQSALMRRALRAFPHAKLYNRYLLDHLKSKRKALQHELKLRKRRLRVQAAQFEAQLSNELRQIKNHSK